MCMKKLLLETAVTVEHFSCAREGEGKRRKMDIASRCNDVRINLQGSLPLDFGLHADNRPFAVDAYEASTYDEC